jgi:diguanylate cyclase (GGDEF)-like protein/PAS domain S-box-containing protein
MQSRPPFAEVLKYQFEHDEFARCDESWRAWIRTGDRVQTPHDYERERPNGTILEVHSVPSPSGGMVRTYTDITARKRADVALRKAEIEYRSLFENAVVGIYRATADGTKIRANPALVRMNGYASEAEFLAADRAANVWYVDPSRHREFMRLLREHGRVDDFVSEVYRCGTSERMWVSETAWTVRGPDNELCFFEGTIVDATERKLAEAQIEHLAKHDSLTGLPNRLLFRQRMTRALSSTDPGEGSVAVLCLDLDRFKTVNDTLGHLVGDELLKRVAERISSAVSEGDMVARFGGDEFVIVLADAGDREEVSAFAGRLIQEAGQPVTVKSHQLTVGISVGIALAGQHGASPDQVLKCADLALYRAKAAGRNTFRFYEPEMDAAAEERQHLELDLRGALARGEFEVHYQPLVRVATGQVAGFEALVRWRHPMRGLISPAEFIAVAEETGLIVPIGNWVLRTACCQAASWPSALRVAVNVSAMQFRHSDLAGDVVSALAAAQLSPNRLELEITESVLIHEAGRVVQTMRQLRAIGVRIALDDFGTGFSSLNYLREFPFDKIKIDQCFTRELGQPNGSLPIVRAVIGIGLDLGVTVTAEGVETEEQLARLKVEGCEEVQGYLFSRPKPATEIAALLGNPNFAMRSAA